MTKKKTIDKKEGYTFPIHLGTASIKSDKVGFNSSKIAYTAVGKLHQTVAYLLKSRLKVTIFESDQTDPLFEGDKVNRIVAVADTNTISVDTDNLSISLSFNKNDVDFETLGIFANNDAMIHVERIGDKGDDQHADDAEGQQLLDGAETDATADAM